MNAPLDLIRKPSVCPHDCPSVCALDVEVIGKNRIGRVYGAPDHPYTAGVVCAKVARYAERIHHPERLMKPLGASDPRGRRSSPKFRGRRRSIASPKRSSKPSAKTARKAYGLIFTPARWAW